MKIAFWIAFLSLGLTVITGCKECDDAEPGMNPSGHNEIIDCHNNVDWVPGGVRAKLVGEWTWVQSFNPWMAAYDSVTFKGVKVILQEDGSAIKDDNGNTDNGTWELIENSNTSFCQYTFKLSFVELSSEGCVYICDDEMLLYNSPVDGLDVWYIKE